MTPAPLRLGRSIVTSHRQPPDPALDERRRRLRYRAWRRGMREADLLLGPFADAEAGLLDARAVTEFEALLDVPDQMVLGWLVDGLEPPPEFRAGLVARIRAFHIRSGADDGQQ